jgi:hypothetical protein
MHTLETGRMVIHCLSSISTQWLQAASSENCQRYPKLAGLPGNGQRLSLFVTGRALDSHESLVVEIVDAGGTGIGE